MTLYLLFVFVSFALELKAVNIQTCKLGDRLVPLLRIACACSRPGLDHPIYFIIISVKSIIKAFDVLTQLI